MTKPTFDMRELAGWTVHINVTLQAKDARDDASP